MEQPGNRKLVIARLVPGSPWALMEFGNGLSIPCLFFSVVYPSLFIATVVLVFAVWIAAAVWACFNMWNGKVNAPPPPHPR